MCPGILGSTVWGQMEYKYQEYCKKKHTYVRY